jgi:hypothetical protein
MSYDLASLHFAKPALNGALVDRVHTEFGERWENVWGGKSIFRGRSPNPNSVR